MKKQKSLLIKILEPLNKEGIDISKIDLGDLQLDRETALTLQREVRMMVMRGQHTTVDLDGQSIQLSPEEISNMLKETIKPYSGSGGKK
ncbi:MAG: hypothetical protein IIB44_09480 [Candidatus Marinimicrobia bacterium]|nr:hypothetical protein [Candidatus Neomarinimicrobiota bacterium]MCH8070177.1 hypothetical protein [Candidatus Neomarinimicrobiota bacterium]